MWGKHAHFENFRWDLQEEARPGGGNIYKKRSTKGFRKPYSLSQSSSKQHNALKFMSGQIRARKLHSYLPHSSDRPGPLVVCELWPGDVGDWRIGVRAPFSVAFFLKSRRAWWIPELTLIAIKKSETEQKKVKKLDPWGSFCLIH